MGSGPFLLGICRKRLGDSRAGRDGTDLYIRLLLRRPTPKRRVWLNRAAVLLIGSLATALAAGKVRAVFDFVLYAWAGLGAAIGPALILVLLWQRTTGWGVLAGMLAGLVTAFVWRETLHSQLYELVPAFVIAFVAVALVSLLTSGEPQPDHE